MKMNKLLRIAFALCILMLSGCASNRASFQSITDPGQSPEPGFGYVAGMFSRDWCPAKLGVGLGIVNTVTAEEYVMPFGAESTMPRRVTDELGLIQLPPGEYRIAYWVTYSTADHEHLTRTDISPDSESSAPFKLASGEVVFLGSHVAGNGQKDGAGGGNQWSVRHQRLSLQTAQKAFSRSYPSFSMQPMTCTTCMK
jgi:hypothetical protein